MACQVSRRRLFASAAGLALSALLTLPSFAADPRLALQGHDPVAYFTLGKPTKGNEQISYVYDETRYLFVSAGHRALFVANPEKYAPMYNGYCAMGMRKGYKLEPDPKNWAIVDGQLFVASSPITPEIMAADGNIAKGLAEWIKIHPVAK